MSNSKAADVPFWGGLHEPIQWLLYLPAVFGFSFLFGFLFDVLSVFRDDFEGVFVYLQRPLNAGLTATLFVWLGLNLAPRAPIFSAWAIYLAGSVLWLLVIFRFIAIAFFGGSIQQAGYDTSIQQADVLELLQGVGWLTAGIFFLLRWGKEFSPTIEAQAEKFKDK